jgi:ribosomal protein L39E
LVSFQSVKRKKHELCQERCGNASTPFIFPEYAGNFTIASAHSQIFIGIDQESVVDPLKYSTGWTGLLSARRNDLVQLSMFMMIIFWMGRAHHNLEDGQRPTRQIFSHNKQTRLMQRFTKKNARLPAFVNMDTHNMKQVSDIMWFGGEGFTVYFIIKS